MEDLDHVQRQLRALQFTETELEESEEAELAAVQRSEKRARDTASQEPRPQEVGTPPAGAIAAAGKPFGSPAGAEAAVAAAGEEVDESWGEEDGGDENEEREDVGMGDVEEEGEGAAPPELTALPPGAPAKGAVPEDTEADILPADPFSMVEGAAAEERGRLASTALQELAALKRG